MRISKSDYDGMVANIFRLEQEIARCKNVCFVAGKATKVANKERLKSVYDKALEAGDFNAALVANEQLGWG